MGLFTRKDSATARKGEARRPPVSSEIQAAELRARARRRLAGSVILVLAAVIILPMVLDSRPAQTADDVSVRIPGKDAPYQPAVSEPQAQQSAQAEAPAPAAQPAADVSSPAPAPASSAPAPSASTPAAPIPEAPAMADLQRSLAKQDQNPPPSKPAESKPQAKPAPVVRTDDGAVAMALLEGRKPPAASPAKPAPGAGNYVLQIAAYSSPADAQSRYAKLRQSGISNAYIEPFTVGGKSQYRLRVGPFPSRDAAQAAQARLRALGYDNGFIATQ